MIGFQLKRTLLLGLRSLWQHRLRSMLTVLGMVCGVCAVIAMLAIGEGGSEEAQAQIKRLGSTNIIIRSVKPPNDPSSQTNTPSMVASYGLTYADVERIAHTIPDVRVTVAARRIPKDVWHLSRHASSSVLGTVPWFPSIAGRSVAQGRFLSSTDLHYMTNVCVLEPAVASALFPAGDALGQTVKVGMNYYRVVGIMAPLTSGKPGEADAAKEDAGAGIYIPLTTARTNFGEIILTVSSGSEIVERVEIHEVVVGMASIDHVLEAADILRQTLRRYHQKQDYELTVPLESMQAARQVRRTYDIVLGSIAAISLLVGGIGIMNIMLASITERTREIGIRRALGAKKKHIILQFLTECVLLSVSGGLIGIGVGIAIPSIVEHFSKMRTILTWTTLLLPFSISVFIGVVFGLYPAYRAAGMDPIEALRHE